MENTNENLPEPDFEDDEHGDEPDYYLCYSCGYNCIEPIGYCPRCTAIMSPEYY